MCVCVSKLQSYFAGLLLALCESQMHYEWMMPYGVWKSDLCVGGRESYIYTYIQCTCGNFSRKFTGHIRCVYTVLANPTYVWTKHYDVCAKEWPICEQSHTMFAQKSDLFVNKAIQCLCKIVTYLWTKAYNVCAKEWPIVFAASTCSVNTVCSLFPLCKGYKYYQKIITPNQRLSRCKDY